jgi:hypothetical protein
MYSISPTGEIVVALDSEKRDKILTLLRSYRHSHPGKIDEYVSSCLAEVTRTTYSKPRILG